MVAALNKQLTQDSSMLNSTIDTVYFGGGTPSLLSDAELEELFLSIKNNYNIAENAEITLEANPDDITEIQAKSWLKLGVNRLSIGIQSFHQENLTTMNRAHSSTEAKQAIEIIKKVGFKNFSVDLMFSLPDLSDEMWINNLQKVIDLKVPHLSCYNLTIEEQTTLKKFIALKKINPLNEDTSINQFTIAMNLLEKAGYKQYEISNYCLPGLESKHNSAYWNQKDYIGVGPSAHSYIKGERSCNIAHNMNYIKGIEKQETTKEIEHLSLENKFNEYILTRLRTSQGISTDDLLYTFEKFAKVIQHAITEQVQLDNIQLDKKYIKLTRKGKYIADQVALALFV
ncbi:MAG: oxygen-independent coproporphyrinogen-3 oxidase [Glaciecola sp.]|jgi:oxygen-independent coproporphyrinogen-3 oxidase